ncbi:MAG: hypothetical protein NVS1B9_03930 [Solirubrobacteraceae bacterium]
MISDAILRAQTDRRLVTLAAEGHNQAFDALARRYRRDLLAHARRVVAADQSEDVVQQGMLNAWSALRSGSQVLDARAWLHQIVHNAGLRALQRPPESELQPEMAMGTDATIDQRRGAREALAALAALPETQRRAIELTALGGHSGREAAQALQISEGALRQLVHRARTALRTGAAAVTPMPVLAWAAGGAGEPTVGRATELFAGAGMAATALKLGAGIALTASLVGGAARVLPDTEPHRTARHAAADTSRAVDSIAQATGTTPSAGAVTLAAQHDAAARAAGAPNASTRHRARPGRDTGRHGGSGEQPSAAERLQNSPVDSLDEHALGSQRAPAEASGSEASLSPQPEVATAAGPVPVATTAAETSDGGSSGSTPGNATP